MQQTDPTTSATINNVMLYKVRNGKVTGKLVYVKG